MDNIINGLEITAIGMSVVFFILLVLYAALKTMELVFAAEAQAPETGAEEPAALQRPAEPRAEDGDPDEEAAVAIAAAVAVHRARVGPGAG